MSDEAWTDKMNRVARAVWELLHTQPEIAYVRAEVILNEAAEPEVLATDVAGGVLWIDASGNDINRQVILPNGELARGSAG